MPEQNLRQTAEGGVNKKREHKVIIINRKNLMVSGVEKVGATSETFIVVDTSEGLLTITGKDLHVTKISVEDGLLEAVGKIIEFKYNEPREKVGLIKRIFR